MIEDRAPSTTERAEPPASGFAQGTVIAWDAVAGTNTIRVHGKDCANIAVLLSGESSFLQEGDRVLVARLNNTYAVLGRLGPPGAQRALAAQSATVAASEASTSATFGALATPGPVVHVNIGASRRCLVVVTARIAVNASSAEMSFAVSGNSTITATVPRPAVAESGASVSGTFSVTTHLTEADGLYPGLNTFTAQYRRPTGASASFSARNLLVLPY